MNLKLAVENGIEFLNEKVPGWFKRINLKTLDMGTCNKCILGQLFGDYDNIEVYQLFDRANLGYYNYDSFCRQREYYGFSCDCCEDYDELLKIWIGRIKELQQENETKETMKETTIVQEHIHA